MLPGKGLLQLSLALGALLVVPIARAVHAADTGECVPPNKRLVSARPVVVPLDSDGRPVNLKFTPLVLSSAASLRGLELSGTARLYERESNHYYLSSGCVLLNTAAPTRIDTCRVSIYAKANSSVVVHAEDDITRVMNLSDRHRASVRIVLGKNFIELSPGQEMGVIAGGRKDPKQLVTGDVLGYRKLQVVPVGDKQKIVLWEFSLDDALKQCYIFRQLRQSPDNVDHKLLDEIVKTAAAVDTMYKKTREAYTHGPQGTVKDNSRAETKLADQQGAEQR